MTKRQKLLFGGGLAVALVLAKRITKAGQSPAGPTDPPDGPPPPSFEPGTNPSLDGVGDITWVGGYGYFQGGSIDPSGHVTYTGQVEELPWYLSWGAGWLF